MLRRQKKIITDGGNSAKVTMEGRFPCAAYKNGVGINSILCQFCRCWVYKRYNSIGGKLKKDNKFKCQSCANFFFFFFNWDSPHARLNSHCEAWSYKKRRTKRITGYRKSV